MTTSSQSSEAQKTFTKACVSAFDNAFGVSPAPPRDTKFLGRDITVNVGNPMRFEIGDPTLERRPGQNSGPPSVFDTKIGDFLVPFLIHPVFVWAPELLWRSLVPGIPCPKCNRTSTVKFQKWNHPPRRVYTIGGHYYLIGREYRCNACKGERGGLSLSFSNYDRRVLGQLPRTVQLNFPCYVTWRFAVDNQICDMVVHGTINGVPFRSMALQLNQLSREAYLLSENRCCVYEEMIGSALQHIFFEPYLSAVLDYKAVYDQAAATSATEQSPRAIDFGPFSGKGNHYNGLEISNQYMQFIFIQMTNCVEPILRKRLDMVTGRALAGDHTFAVAKKVTTGGGDTPYAAMYNVKNEDGKSVGSVLVPDTKMKTLGEFLIGLRQRYVNAGEPLPVGFETDTCCSNRSAILEALGRDAASKCGTGGGLTKIKLGLFHATQRITSAATSGHPLRAPFAKEISNSFTVFDEAHYDLLCKCIQAKGRTEGKNISDDDAKMEADKCATKHCARYGPVGRIILRNSLGVMYAYNEAGVVPFFGPVLGLNTWKAYFELATHMVATRSCGSECLTDSEELLRSGGLYRVVKPANEATGARQEVQKTVSDSHVEALFLFLFL